MLYNIEIQPSGAHFKSESNILDDALSQNISLEHSCKSGQCGACSAEIISGMIENEHQEIVSSGSILTCQSKAVSDAVLKAECYPELSHLEEQILPCKLSSIRYVTADIVVLKFRFPPNAYFEYISGQYVDLNYKGVIRSYSIANADTNGKEIELHIRKVELGRMSELLFNNLKENQLMRIEGPKGTFFIREGCKSLILMATGTGIAPVKAIVESLVASNDKREVYIYWGMRYEKELYCVELNKYAQENNHIHFIPVLSRESNENYRSGYIQDAVLEDFESLNDMDVYACGSPEMIENAKYAFIEQKQLPLKAFYSDAFTFAK